MVNIDCRITKEADWQRIHRRGNKVYTPEIVLKYLKNNLKVSRFGIIVSTKVSKKATQRNLIKRRLKVIISGKFNELKAGYDIIIITRSKINACSFQEIKGFLIKLLKKAQLVV